MRFSGNGGIGGDDMAACTHGCRGSAAGKNDAGGGAKAERCLLGGGGSGAVSSNI